MKHFFSVLFLLLISITLSAQLDTTKVYDLESVEVVSQRTSVASKAIRPILVINSEELKSMPVQSINELLDYLPGIDLRARSTGGVQADISMRGGTFDQVLVLINSINITDPQTGHLNLDLPIDLNMIERIEILQGTSISLFGLSAFSGAINIIVGSETEKMVKARIVAGQHGFVAPSLGINYVKEKWQFNGQTSYTASEGYINNTDFKTGNLFLIGSYRDKKIGNFQLQLGGQLKEFGANSFYSLSYPNQFEATKTLLSSLKWDKNIGDFRIEAAAYYRGHQDRFELFRSNQNAPTWYTFHNHHITHVGGTYLKGAWFSSIGKTSVGVEVRDEYIVSNVLGDNLKEPIHVPFQTDSIFFTKNKNRLNINYFLEQNFYIKKLTFGVGISGNYNSMFQHNYAFGVNAGWNFTQGGNVYANINRALRLPTFTDLYYQSATQISNPELTPETSLTSEIGISWNRYGLRTSLNAYYRIGKDIIDWVKEPEEERWRSVNHSRIDAMGGEFSASYSHGYWLKDIGINYSFCHLNKGQDGTLLSKYALDYLQHKVVLSLEHGIYKGFGARWQYLYQDRLGSYSNVKGEVVNYNPFSLFDGRIYWQNETLNIFIEANNLFNIQYYDYGGIEQPGIWVKAGISANINLK